ncbi:unnamed protein product [Zymoseptoria tritici ST99CH_3D7]|uniref:Delta(24)-sterol reductase n=1 Tax=Zymoseptoria tritici (strain ST99CH_3D7) TaxID=1276538 RepID=A0A1X7S492_ZYMT9|nr:unnamed protein product [Zymoseptoria tritici ST99CH_3D7]
MSNARSMKRLNGIAKSAPSLCFAQQDALPTQSQIIARFCSQWTSRRTSLELPRQKPCPSRRLSATRQLSSSSPSFRPIQHGGTAPTTLEAHNREVASIAARVRDFYDRKEKFRIAHGSTNSTRKNSKDPKKLVDTSRLNHVVKVDTVNKTALVEPNVPMDRLVEELLKYGLVPPVVMEFPGITVGGGYSGTSGESSSFKHGFFDRTLKSVEMVLATGEVVTLSENERADLFRGAAGAVGTMGVTTMVELQNLHTATKFVETTYHPVVSMQDAIEKLQNFTSRPVDFDYVDGLMFSLTSGAIVTGKMTDTSTSPIQRFSDAKDPWFYLHVQDKISRSSEPTSEAVPLPEYLFRYDRGGFWVGKGAFEYMKFPFNRTTRWFLDDFLHTRMLYNALHSSGRSEQMIVQDLALPYHTATEFVERMDRLTGIWPLWLCPLKQSTGKTMHPHFQADKAEPEQLLNIGLWGRSPPPQTSESFIQTNRAIEETLQELGGMKWLYAQTYFNETDFWKDFDQEWYNGLREKYHATTLPTVYEKVRVDVEAERKARESRSWTQRVREMWPFAGLYGLRQSIKSRDYMKAREATWKDWVPRE